MTIRANIAQITATLEKARQNSPLAAPVITILGASKGQNASRIEEGVAAGLTVFGENRVQEAYEKWPELKKKHPNLQLHLIGPLQTNKIKDALSLFDVIQTVDRPKLAEALAQVMGGGRGVEGQNKTTLRASHATRHLYIQINTGEEPQKAGILPQDADHFIEDCISRLKLPIVGLMCVPPADQPPPPHFAMLREIAKRHGLKELSMGMSGDFDVAARMGSSCVRIGTALFGARA